jgi:hypothetical protein
MDMKIPRTPEQGRKWYLRTSPAPRKAAIFYLLLRPDGTPVPRFTALAAPVDQASKSFTPHFKHSIRSGRGGQPKKTCAKQPNRLKLRH